MTNNSNAIKLRLSRANYIGEIGLMIDKGELPHQIANIVTSLMHSLFHHGCEPRIDPELTSWVKICLAEGITVDGVPYNIHGSILPRNKWKFGDIGFYLLIPKIEICCLEDIPHFLWPKKIRRKVFIASN